MKTSPIDNFNRAVVEFTDKARQCAAELRAVADTMDRVAAAADTTGAGDFLPDTVLAIREKAVLGRQARDQDNIDRAESAVVRELESLADVDTLGEPSVTELPPFPPRKTA